MRCHWIMLAYITVALSFTDLAGQSLSSVRIDRDTIRMGEPFYMHFQLRLPESQGVVLDFATLDTIRNLMYEVDSVNFSEFADLHIRRGGEHLKIDNSNKLVYWDRLSGIKNDGFKFIRDSVLVVMYDLGVYRMHGPQLKRIGVENVLATERPLLTVILPDEILNNLQDSISMAPLKTIMTEPLTIEDFRFLLIGLGILLLVAAGIFLLRRMRSKERIQKMEEAVIISAPPHETALRKLRELKEKELWQKGQIKEYQSELTFIIREYLQDRFTMNALEMTTSEILREVPEFVDTEKLGNILQIADLVKFAKAVPGEEIHEKFMQMAFELVEETKRIEVADA